MSLLRYIKHFIQRGRRGWSDRDVWDLAAYLAGVIEGSVEHLRQTTGGYPCPRGEWPWTEEQTARAEQDWNETLAAISLGFGLMARDEDLMEGDRIVTPCEQRPEYKRAMSLFAEWFPSLWD